jgi:hypothetical protein
VISVWTALGTDSATTSSPCCLNAHNLNTETHGCHRNHHDGDEARLGACERQDIYCARMTAAEPNLRTTIPLSVAGVAVFLFPDVEIPGVVWHSLGESAGICPQETSLAHHPHAIGSTGTVIRPCAKEEHPATQALASLPSVLRALVDSDHLSL